MILFVLQAHALTEDAARAAARDAVESWRIAPAVVIAWVSPDGRGVVAHGDGVDASTVFQVGSITKTVTGLLLAEMVGRGEARLDEPVGALLPELSGGAAAITLEALATHTSGLPRMPVGPALLAAVLLHRGDPYRGLGVDDVLAAVEPDEPGGEFAYSNLGASVLGHALARRAGLPYAELASRRVLVPLGMPAFEDAGPRALGHGVNLDPVPSWTFDGYAPAGGLAASGAAMLRYLAANLDGSAPGATLAHAPRVEIEPGERVGLAWMISERRGRTITWHNGGTGGFRSFLGFDRERRVGVVVLANADNSVDRVGAWLLGVADAPAPPRASVGGVSMLAALVAWGVALGVLARRAPLTGWRRAVVGASRLEAAARVGGILVMLGFLADFVDWRATPGVYAAGAVLALAVHGRLVVSAAPSTAGWAMRAWTVGITLLMLWAGWVSPRVG